MNGNHEQRESIMSKQPPKPLSGPTAAPATDSANNPDLGPVLGTVTDSKEPLTSTEVTIMDKEYRINCPQSEQEALLASARYLDGNMRKIKKRGNIQGIEKVAIMAALNITNEMLRKNRLISESRRVTSQQVTWLEDKVDQALVKGRQPDLL